MIKGLEKNRYFFLWENFLKVNCFEMIWMVRFDGVFLLFYLFDNYMIYLNFCYIINVYVCVIVLIKYF